MRKGREVAKVGAARNRQESVSNESLWRHWGRPARVVLIKPVTQQILHLQSSTSQPIRRHQAFWTSRASTRRTAKGSLFPLASCLRPASPRSSTVDRGAPLRTHLLDLFFPPLFERTISKPSIRVLCWWMPGDGGVEVVEQGEEGCDALRVAVGEVSCAERVMWQRKRRRRKMQETGSESVQ